MTRQINRRTRLSAPSPKSQNIAFLILKGVLASLTVSICLAFILSLICLFTQITYFEMNLQYTMVGITMVSIFFGSVYSTKKIESKGLLVGMTVGLVYVVISLAVSVSLIQEPFSTLLIINKIAAGVAAGALGGFVGVNI